VAVDAVRFVERRVPDKLINSESDDRRGGNDIRAVDEIEGDDRASHECSGHGSFAVEGTLLTTRIDLARTPRSILYDEIFGGPGRVGLSYALGGDHTQGGDVAMGSSEGAFGHGGNGGSLGFADPARRLSFGLTKNLMKATPDPRQSTAFRIAAAVRAHLDRAE
jgi:CubicO group peptidase (beta-lactamase class C family)